MLQQNQEEDTEIPHISLKPPHSLSHHQHLYYGIKIDKPTTQITVIQSPWFAFNVILYGFAKMCKGMYLPL
jgi:hypothetical protein